MRFCRLQTIEVLIVPIDVDFISFEKVVHAVISFEKRVETIIGRRWTGL